MDNKNQISIWYFIATFALLLLMQSLFDPRHTETLAYSDFKQVLRAGQLISVELKDGVATGSIRKEGLEQVLPKEKRDALKSGTGEHRFVTALLGDPNLVKELDEAKVRYTALPENKWLGALVSWVAPAAIFFGIWMLVMKRMGGGVHAGMLEIGKSKAKVYMQTETGVTFADVAGIDEAKEELMEVVDFLKMPERYRRLGGKIPKGVLIVGAPGTGKTLLAKAVAGEAGVPFLSLSGSEFVEMFVGVGAARVRDLFEQAAKRAPCIVFIDELDALGKSRGLSVMGGGNDEREQTLNQLLVQMDGFDTNSGVIIMAATNRPEILDPALLRPGRFDRQVALDRPDLKGRLQILRVHTRKVKLAPELDLEAIAARTPGFAGADLANLVNEATLRAAKRGKEAVEAVDFDDALDRIVGGLEKKNRVMNQKEREFVAVHEAGHALVAEHRSNVDRVARISIIPRGIGTLGYTQQQPTEDRYLLRKSEILDRIDVLLAGRVAEEILLQDVSTGAENDLERATEMARHMVTHYGMSEELGLATYGGQPVPMYLGGPALPEQRNCSEQTAQRIDAEVAGLLAQSRLRVRDTLTRHRASLLALSQLLLEKEVVDRPMLVQFLRQHSGTATRPAAQSQMEAVA
jgi:cell division protease FtsH